MAVSPLWRGGNRQVPLILLEGVALVCLVAISWRISRGQRLRGVSVEGALIAFLLLSPLWLALVYLTPLPAELWRAAAGRELYWGLLEQAAIPRGDGLPLSLLPDATAVSLLAGIPVATAFLVGYLLRLPQLRLVLSVVVAVALFQVLLGLLQAAGPGDSVLYFGAGGGRPIGTFGNANHYANYIAMALAAYIWLAWSSLSEDRGHTRHHHHRRGVLRGHTTLLWIAGGVFLAIGVLASRSRGSMLAGLAAAVLALALAVTVGSRTIRWRTALLVLGGSVTAAVVLAGVDMVVSRFNVSGFTSDASFRAMLASTTLQGAAHFWPWGAGWGTYAAVYPRFQPPETIGFVEYAHQDYAQMLFEGGIFAALLMVAFAWLVIRRLVLLTREAWRNHRLRREEMAAAICGCGLLGFLLHSLVEFNMHIPANAITAAFLAGAFLRPLRRNGERATDSNGEAASD